VLLLAGLVVIAATIGLGRWKLRGSDEVSQWVVLGLSLAASVIGLVLGGIVLGAVGLLVVGLGAGAGLVFGYRWLARRKRTRLPAATTAVVPTVAPVSSSSDVDGMKPCPDCAELVRIDARACRYCGYRFEDVTPEDPDWEHTAVAVVSAGEEAAAVADSGSRAVSAEPAESFTPVAVASVRNRFCPNCGTEFGSESEFCGMCGARRP